MGYDKSQDPSQERKNTIINESDVNTDILAPADDNNGSVSKKDTTELKDSVRLPASKASDSKIEFNQLIIPIKHLKNSLESTPTNKICEETKKERKQSTKIKSTSINNIAESFNQNELLTIIAAPQRDRQHSKEQQPHPEQEQPHPEEQKPHPEQEQPHPEEQKPHPEQEQPHPEEQQPHHELEQPHPEEQQPHPEQEQPHPEEQQPHPEQEQQHPEEQPPHPEEQQPHPELEQPHPELEQPHPEEQQQHPSCQLRQNILSVSFFKKVNPQELKDVLSNSDREEASRLLRKSIAKGNVELSLALLQLTPEVDDPDEARRTPLMLAADRGQHVVVKALIDRGSHLETVDKDGRTALSRACIAGHVRAAKVLMDCGSNTQHKDIDGLTCLQLAERFRQHQILRLIDSNYFKYRGVRALHSTLRANTENSQSTSKAISKAMNKAGFTSKRISQHQNMAEFLNNVARQVTRRDITLTGSYCEGWGLKLAQVNGKVSSDSDINWTVNVTPDQPVHLRDGCRCSSVSQDALIHVKEGYAQVDTSVGSEAAVRTAGSGIRPTESVCFARPCCGADIDGLRHLGNVPADTRPHLHLVPAARPNQDREARVSTSFLDKSVMRSLNDVQGQLFVLLKFIFKRLLSSQIATLGLKTYHAKTLFFHLLDKHGLQNEHVWKPENLISLLSEALEQMLEFLDSDESPDICMPSFFLPDCQLYFSNAGIGGDFEQSKSRVRDQVVQLKENVAEIIAKKLKGVFGPLAQDHFYFHPFTHLPLVLLESSRNEHIEEDRDSHADEFADAYRTIATCLKQLSKPRDGSTKESELEPLAHLKGQPWCQTAVVCLTALVHLKHEDTSSAREVLSDLTSHEVMRSWEPRQIERLLESPPSSDWAWRFCIPCDDVESRDFSFLSGFTRTLLVTRESRSGDSHLYVNFCCLAWSLQAELLHVTDVDAWFEQLQVDPDFEELATVAQYSSSREEMQFCLATMEALMNENKQAFDREDMNSVYHIRESLRSLASRQCSSEPRSSHSPNEWSEKDLEHQIACSRDFNKQLPPANETLLIVSAKKGRTDLVRKLLEKSPSAALICDASGRSALSWASDLGNQQVVEAFQTVGALSQADLFAAVNRPDNKRQTPLMLAAQSGHANVTDRLLRLGADPQLSDSLRDTALTLAARHGSAAVAEVLVTAGSDATHADIFGNTPLIWAARTGQLEVLKVLSRVVQRLEDWQVVGECQRTCLQWAEYGNHRECADFIRDCIRRLPNQSSPPEAVHQPPSQDPPDNQGGSRQPYANSGGDSSSVEGSGGSSGSTGGADADPTLSYNVGKREQRLAIVINNIQFDINPDTNERETTRRGAEIDSDCLPQCLRMLGFRYEIYRDVPEAFFDRLPETQEITEDDLKNCCALMICIMSHGELDCVCSSDGAKVCLKKLFERVRASSLLKDKPKMFLIQACRHVPRDREVRACPGLENALKNEDSLYIYSVTEGDKSERCPVSGTPFIQAFTDSVIEAYSDPRSEPPEFTLLIPKVTSAVASNTEQRQIPCYTSTLRKKLLFPKD